MESPKIKLRVINTSLTLKDIILFNAWQDAAKANHPFNERGDFYRDGIIITSLGDETYSKIVSNSLQTPVTILRSSVISDNSFVFYKVVTTEENGDEIGKTIIFLTEDLNNEKDKSIISKSPYRIDGSTRIIFRMHPESTIDIELN